MKAFISHSSKDKAKADLLVEHLENNNLSCWIAPRNIPPSANYAKEITKAIDGCEYLILLLTKDSNASDAVAGEIEMAFNRGKPIIPVRLNEISASPSLELFISRSQWVDAYNKPLFHSAKEFLVDTLSGEPPTLNKPVNKGNKKALGYVVVGTILVSLIFGGFKYYDINSLSNSKETVAQQSLPPQQTEMQKSYGLPDLKLALQKGDINTLKAVLSDKLNHKLLFQSEHQHSHTVFINGLVQNKINYAEVIKYLVSQELLDLNQIFEINYQTVAMDIPQSIQSAYLQNLNAVYSREISFEVWKEKVKNTFGYDMPNSWKEMYEKSNYPMDIMQAYLSYPTSIDVSILELAKLVNNEMVIDYLKDTGVSFPKSVIKLSNGVKVPFKFEDINKLSKVFSSKTNWAKLKVDETVKLSQKEDNHKVTNIQPSELKKLKYDKRHAQLQINKALQFNDVEILKLYHTSNVPFSVLDDAFIKGSSAYILESLDEAKYDAFIYLVNNNLIDLSKHYRHYVMLNEHIKLAQKVDAKLDSLAKELNEKPLPELFTSSKQNGVNFDERFKQKLISTLASGSKSDIQIALIPLYTILDRSSKEALTYMHADIVGYLKYTESNKKLSNRLEELNYKWWAGKTTVTIEFPNVITLKIQI